MIPSVADNDPRRLWSAVVTALADVKGQFSGAEGDGRYRVTHVWVRRGGGWKLAAIQMTRVAPQ